MAEERDGCTGVAADGGLRAGAGRRLVLHSMPAAAATLPAGLSYRLELEGLGAWAVRPNGGHAEVTEVPMGGDLNGDAFAISTDPATLAQLASGPQPARRDSPPSPAASGPAPQGPGPPQALR